MEIESTHHYNDKENNTNNTVDRCISWYRNEAVHYWPSFVQFGNARQPIKVHLLLKLHASITGAAAMWTGCHLIGNRPPGWVSSLQMWLTKGNMKRGDKPMLCVQFTDDFLSQKVALVTKLLTNSSSVFLFQQSSRSTDSLPRKPCCLQPVTRQTVPKKTTHVLSGNYEGRKDSDEQKGSCVVGTT